jgi:RNA:NAD 2'-phosphotransferase (TPT1/KptA family)
MGRYKDHVDADLDITKSETCVSNWHRGIVKKPVKTYIQRMSEEEKQVIVDDLKKGVPVPIIIESRKASGKIVRRLASENGVILKRGAVPRKLLKLHRSAV